MLALQVSNAVAFNLHLHATWQQLCNYLELQQDVNSWMKKAVILASLPSLLTPAFDMYVCLYVQGALDKCILYV